MRERERQADRPLLQVQEGGAVRGSLGPALLHHRQYVPAAPVWHTRPQLLVPHLRHDLPTERRWAGKSGQKADCGPGSSQRAEREALIGRAGKQWAGRVANSEPGIVRSWVACGWADLRHLLALVRLPPRGHL